MMLFRSLVLPFGLAFALAVPALAQTLPAPQSATVSDFADVLDATEEGRVSRLLEEVQTETGVQMVVVTMPGLDAVGTGTDAYGKALFNAWGVGGADRNDGILLLIDTKGREARITLGAGYDPVYDGRAARVLSTAVLPALREGRIAGAVEAGIMSSRDRLIVPFLAGQPVGVTDGFPVEDSGSGWTGVAVFGGVAALVGFAVWRQRRTKVTCPNCGAPTLERNREIIDPPTRSESGTGMQHLTCSACGFTDRKSYPIRYSSSEAKRDRALGNQRGTGSASGGSGFGGGRSSGGGASGKW